MERNSTVSQWGNSLGVRIPQEAAAHLNLKAGARVRVEVRADSLTIRPLRARKKWTEAELLKGVTPEIVGGEVDWGGPVGREVW
jgi:antitoxin MazE